ncbi:MAG TPA: response regulator transcription factor [Anaerolineaceae bacterium]|nr:response regulator transcription factor [Anaerolineaceae bacterium]HNT55423.1 response regulator transcription factor [Anaerolineaceae bacterium]
MDKDPLILLIDDEPQILRALKTILTANHFRVVTAITGEEGLAMAATQEPDVIILDLTLPDINGMQVCEQIREWSKTPIIVLTVRDSESDKVLALDKGADDYLTKPFGIEELLARIRVALRHSAQSLGNRQSIIKAGGITIDLARHIVTQREEEIRFTATEFKLLAYLAAHADRVLTHQAILTQVWGRDDFDHVEYLRVYIGQLRKKIELDPNEPKIILTESGIGYRFRSTD